MLIVPKLLAVKATYALAQVDYSVANKVSEDVASIVQWSYNHDQWWIARLSIQLLQNFDFIGAQLISLVTWIILHAN